MNSDLLHALPTVNALLNATSGILLALAYVAIKKNRDAQLHKQLTLSALAVSALFLTSYLIYHAFAGSVHYPIHDWTRTLYLIILVPHTILAGLMVPFIIAAVWFGLKGRYKSHVKITKRLWPVWMFVSTTGVIVYLMLYVYAGAKAL